jgi:ubiquinone/menaquinone biosynthesis C-methylase UbiE
MIEPERSYLPAAGRHAFLPFYDPFSKLIGVDKARRALLDQAELRPNQRVLDVGCGTGSLLVAAKQREPLAELVGIDPDPKVLTRARRKAARAGVRVQLDQGFADALPYDDASFDRVLSSLMFHHVPKQDKAKMLAEIRRVLKSGGRLELMDLAGRGHGRASRVQRWLHSHEHFEDNDERRVLELLGGAGFSQVRIARRGKVLFGELVYYRALR